METVIEIVGLGYVGFPLALQTASRGYQVLGVDKNDAILHGIRSGNSPVTLDEHIRNLMNNVTIDVFSSVQPADVFIVCVPTPVRGKHLPDLGYVIEAAKEISGVLKDGDLVIIESTIYPGVCDDIVNPLLQVANKKFDLVHCPERINPGDPYWNVSNIPRVVGGNSIEAAERAREFYQSIMDGEITVLSQTKAAEATKILENTFRDINIAFINEMAQSFHRLGIDISEVIRGASSKPFGFMPHYPGIGVGGHCIAVDPYYMIERGKEVGFEHDFLSLARKINSAMPTFTVEVIQDGLNDLGKSLNGSRICVLGLSYKPNVSDIRESPTLEVISLLKQKKADVVIFDPFLPEESDAESLEEAIADCCCVLLATAHDAFLKNVEIFKDVPLFVDGRNKLDKIKMRQMGVLYRGIGIKE